MNFTYRHILLMVLILAVLKLYGYVLLPWWVLISLAMFVPGVIAFLWLVMFIFRVAEIMHAKYINRMFDKADKEYERD